MSPPLKTKRTADVSNPDYKFVMAVLEQKLKEQTAVTEAHASTIRRLNATIDGQRTQIEHWKDRAERSTSFEDRRREQAAQRDREIKEHRAHTKERDSVLERRSIWRQTYAQVMALAPMPHREDNYHQNERLQQAWDAAHKAVVAYDSAIKDGLL